MPLEDSKSYKLLGDDAETSFPIFCDLFTEDKIRFLSMFKSKAGGSFTYRAFAKNASAAESLKALATAKTPYKAVLQDILSKAEGCNVGLAANLRYIVNASHAEVSNDRKGRGGGLSFLASKPAVLSESARDELYPPMHRLLVEQHVYAFTWKPNYSSTYHVASAGMALGSLAFSAVATAGSLGAAAPALIQSLRQAANATGDIIKLVAQVKDVVDQLTAVRDQVAETREFASQASEHLQALSGSGSASGFKMPERSGSGLSLQPKTVSRFGGLIKRKESDKEVLARMGANLNKVESDLQKYQFVVIQQITPMIQIRDNIDVTADNPDLIGYTLKTYIANRSIIRAGETDRDTFNRMLVEARSPTLDQPSAAQTLCWPWPSEALFARYIRTPHAGLAPLASDPSVAYVKWNDLSANEWVLADEQPGTMPLPASLKAARQKRQAAELQARAARVATLTARFPGNLRGAVAHRKLQEAQEKNRRMALILKVRSELPSVDQFKRSTTTKTGPFVNKRNNPKLLMIDLALDAAHTAASRAGGPLAGADMTLEQVSGALHAIQEACDDYLVEKRAAVSGAGGKLSARVAPVDDLKRKVMRLLPQIA